MKFFSSLKWPGHKKQRSPAAADTPQEGRTGAMVVWSETVERRWLEEDLQVTSNFVPEAKGRQATLEWLRTRTSEALSGLKAERDRAARQNRRGPKNRGAKEVKEILKRPCRTTVEQLQQVREHAEVAVRYGAATGAVVHSLSQSFRGGAVGTRFSAPKLPALQLKDFSTMVRDQLELVSRMPTSALNSSSPRAWFSPRTPRRGRSIDSTPPLSPLDTGCAARRTGRAEKGVEERKREHEDRQDSRRSSLSPVESDAEDDPYENITPTTTALDEWENREATWVATWVSMVNIPRAKKVNVVHGRRRQERDWQPMPKINEASTTA